MWKMKWLYFVVPMVVTAVIVGVYIKSEPDSGKEKSTQENSVNREPASGEKEATTVTPTATSTEDAGHHPAPAAPENPVVEATEQGHSTNNLKELAAQAHKKVDEIQEAPQPSTSLEPCTSIEFRGMSPEKIKIEPKKWAHIMNAFHWSKAQLLVWLKKQGKNIKPEILSWMEKQVKTLKIQRPPSLDEPDLSWRGIGALTYDEKGVALIRLGGGFLSLMEQKPDRAKFELTRLLAQAWEPCTFQGKQPWSEMLACFHIQDSQACQEGSYSEAGWAVSTVLAHLVSFPGCTVPAFKNPEFAACLEKFSASDTHSAQGFELGMEFYLAETGAKTMNGWGR